MGDKEPTIDETYVLTPSVKLNLRDIVRVVSSGYVWVFIPAAVKLLQAGAFLDTYWLTESSWLWFFSLCKAVFLSIWLFGESDNAYRLLTNFKLGFWL